MYDWTNYEHWVESCYLFHALVENYADNINASIHKYDKIRNLMHIALPTVRPERKGTCDRIPDVPGIYGGVNFGEQANDPASTSPSHHLEVPSNVIVGQGKIVKHWASSIPPPYHTF